MKRVIDLQQTLRSLANHDEHHDLIDIRVHEIKLSGKPRRRQGFWINMNPKRNRQITLVFSPKNEKAEQ